MLLERLDKVFACNRHVVNSEVAILVPYGAVCPPLQEQAGDCRLVSPSSIEEDGLAFFVGEIYLGALIQQLLHD